ncbi:MULTISPECIES: cation:proton antiporter [Shewanella]|uniref:Cation:proton antiporter n=1 Tax=Shewanella indica TaxID=768528 RepID=A0ABU4Q7A4_9GAMM|nr:MULTISPECIES: cation:proton antiporter [Shewanella]MDX6015317.1 cation:proton antiporter [Shewanella indica]NDO74440.1 cation:proton antiporter [Shewanella sp. SE1]OIN13455.1 sodium:proton exchanger [Shewanella algae]TVP12870.1 sodium:proton exchanger [Shewanella sp. MSW]
MSMDSLLIALFLILLFSRVLGECCNRIGWPAVVGEIGAGLLLGPSVLGWLEPTQVLANIAELGVILLLFSIGAETSIQRLYSAGRQVVAVAIIGIIAPLLLTGLAAFYWLELSLFAALFYGCTLTATSIGISLRVLSDSGQQQSSAGHLILGAAVFDDIAGVILLSLLFNFASEGQLAPLAIIKLCGLLLLFLLLAPPLGRMLIYPLRVLSYQSQTPGYEAVVMLTLICLFAWLAHLFGAPALLGGFVAGLALSRQFIWPWQKYLQNPFPFTHKLEKSMQPLTDVFAPVFFVYVGISLDLSQLNLSPYSLLLLLAMILLAFIGKLAAGLVVSGTWRQKLIVGSAMVPRGEVGLVFAEVGRQLDIIPAKVFTELVLVIAITTLLGPLLLRRLLPKEGEA